MKKLMKKIIVFFLCVGLVGGTVSVSAESILTPDEAGGFSLQDALDAVGDAEDTEEDTGTYVEGVDTSEADTAADEETVNVLFIGNSFTKYSGYSVGKILKQMAAGSGKKLSPTIITHASAYLSYYAFLSEKYKAYYQEVYSTLMGGTSFDYIVLQDQSTCGVTNKENGMFASIRQLYNVILKFQPDAKVLLYSTHGYDNGSNVNIDGTSTHLTETQLQQKTAAAYAEIAEELGVTVVPVGMQFVHCGKLYPGINLIGPDDKHPNYAGYFLAASTFYYTIFKELPTATRDAFASCELTDVELQQLYSLVDDSMKSSSAKVTVSTGATKQIGASIVSDEKSGASVSYASMDKSVATVNASTGLITGVCAGKTAIIATSSSGLQSFVIVTVKDSTIPKIGFAKSSYEVGLGDVFRLLPSVTTYYVPDDYTWESSNQAVAKVSTDGTVTTRKAGVATITVKNNKTATLTASYTLYVKCTKVTGLTVTLTGVGSATKRVGKAKLTWTKAPGATSYFIYRSTSAGGTYTYIGASTKNTYTDKTITGNQWYYYKVSAIAESGETQGDLSAKKKVFMPGVSDDIVVKTAKTGITIAWKNNSKLTGYEIYRSTKKNSGYKKIAQKSKSVKKYTDKTVKKGKTYYYKIRAYKTVNGVKVYSAYFTRLKASAKTMTKAQKKKYNAAYQAFLLS